MDEDADTGGTGDVADGAAAGGEGVVVEVLRPHDDGDGLAIDHGDIVEGAGEGGHDAPAMTAGSGLVGDEQQARRRHPAMVPADAGPVDPGAWLLPCRRRGAALFPIIRTAVDVAEDVLRAGVAGLAVRGLVRETLPELPLPALLSTVTPRHRRPCFDHVPLPTRLVVRAVDVAVARTLGPGTCLFRSLARYAALRQARVDARFVIGVAASSAASSSSSPAPQPFVAHAWIEVGGAPVFEAAPPRYAETFCWPAREAR
jgi:hypothetical protein